MLMVQKFGGTSLANADRIRMAARRCVELVQKGWQVVAVVSAQGDTTDEMLVKISEITDKPTAREVDAYLSAGETMSAALVAMAIRELGQEAVSLTGPQAGVMTDGVYGNARVLGLRGDRIKRELGQGRIVVVAGFQGLSGNGDITTLGRGGSDTTAVALAAFLNARLCRIYTDVDGIYDKDPRLYDDAVKLPVVDYDKMLFMARQGAQVLHDRCVELAQLYRVDIQVLSSFRPGVGSFVSDREDAQEDFSPIS